MSLVNALKRALPLWSYDVLMGVSSLFRWRKSLYAPPAPIFVKQSILKRQSINGGLWVETGTYLGQTTNFLSKFSKHVYTVELEPTLAARAKARFKGKNVTVIQGGSEDVFPELLKSLSGDVNFWLDGHFSAGMTAKGVIETPIRVELREIETNLSHFGKVVVFVDDLRCFEASSGATSDYPPVEYLIAWANRLGFRWSIENDIFIARRP